MIVHFLVPGSLLEGPHLYLAVAVISLFVVWYSLFVHPLLLTLLLDVTSYLCFLFLVCCMLFVVCCLFFVMSLYPKTSNIL